MNLRRLLPVLLGTLALLASSALVSASAGPASAATAARASKASQDYPHLPRYCATPKEVIPQKPVLCHLDRNVSGHPTIVLWGDSHAWMMIPALRAAAKGRDVNLVAAVMGGCPPMDPRLTAGQAAPSCDKSNDQALRYVEKLARGKQRLTVLLGASWQRYYHAIKTHDRSDYVGTQAVQMQQQTKRLFRALTADGVDVVVNGQVATVPEKRAVCALGELPYSCNLSRRSSLPEASATLRYLLDFMKPLPGHPQPLDVNGAMCSKQACHGKIGSVHTWFDDLHLSATRSRGLASYLRPVVDAVVSEDAAGSSASSSSGSRCAVPLLC